MKTLSSRLTHALKVRKKTPAELARATGKTESAVSQWLSGETKSMRSDSLMATCALLSCNAQWLASGKGASGLESDEVLAGGKSKPDELVIPQFDTGGAMGDGLILRDQPGVIRGWSVNKEWLNKNLKNHTGAGNLCIVTGFGDSMKGMYNSGDPLVVDTGVKKVEYDAVYFFRVGDEGFIKRLQRIPGEGLVAISENKAYRDWTIKPDMDFEVFGRVLKAWKGEDF
jgi:transcriptional regulator with XRE-family HTH domain